MQCLIQTDHTTLPILIECPPLKAIMRLGVASRVFYIGTGYTIKECTVSYSHLWNLLDASARVGKFLCNIIRIIVMSSLSVSDQIMVDGCNSSIYFLYMQLR